MPKGLGLYCASLRINRLKLVVDPTSSAANLASLAQMRA